MWEVINKTVHEKNSCVLLTTHSMAEAEALSQRMAIQVDGVL